MARRRVRGKTNGDVRGYKRAMRLLFITSNRIGDAVMTTGVYRRLAEQNPDLRAWVASLFADAPGVERVIEMRKLPRKGHWLRLFRLAARRRWDLVVDLRDSAVSRLLPFAKRRLIVGKGPYDRHRVEFLGQAGGFDDAPDPTLWIGAPAEDAARRMIPDGPPVLAIAPGANWVGKRWRPNFFAELAARALSPRGPFANGRLAVLGAPDDEEACAPTLARIPAARRIDLVGKTDPQTAGACLMRCSAFVGNDSGLAHIAAAAATPTLALFGPGTETVFRPWGPTARVCRAQIAEKDLNRIRWDQPDQVDQLMDSLTVSMAERALIALMADFAPESRAA